MSYGASQVDESQNLPGASYANGYNPLRLWKPGVYFEYLAVTFWTGPSAHAEPYSFTLRKELYDQAKTGTRECSHP